ncbi:MAG: glutamine synthetase family protein [Nitrososphaerales archaeon]|nr:glutamine synthetase family protein [Nitrososphaerales archaeon]
MKQSAVAKRLSQHNSSMVSISYVDLCGVTRSKPLVVSDVESILRNGFKTARANLDMNAVTPLTPGSKLDISQGDVSVIPDQTTLVFPAYSPGTARFIGEVHEADGSTSPLCARSVLRRVLEETGSRGYRVMTGLESEFHLVRHDGDRVVPADTSSIQSQAGYEQHRELLTDIVKALSSMEIKVVKAHVEGGHGQLEVDLAPEPCLRAGDAYVYFKDAVKAVSMSRGLTASFMPKIGADWWGSGLHLHLNLTDPKGRNLFSDSRDRRKLGLSQSCYHFIGGVLKHTRALCAIGAPTVNSYKRLLPGRWNADAVTYGPGNRGAAVRIPDERGDSTRIELRLTDNACNVYLLLACVVAAGIEGMERKLDPGEPLMFDASQMNDSERVSRHLKLLPRSLGEALSELEKDDLIRRTLGGTLFEEYVTQRSFEVSQAADQVTQWEVSHFLDLF